MKLFVVVKTLAIVIVIVVATSTFLAGCGGVADNLCRSHLTVHTGRVGQPLTVSHRTVYTDNFVHGQNVVADSRGDAVAEFDYMWNAAFVVIPPLGMVPNRAPKPDYLIVGDHQRAVITPKSPNAKYQWEHGGWITEVTLPR